MSEQNDRNDVLLAVYQSHREESLQHRQTILNVFMLVFAGLLAMSAAIVAQDYLSRWMKIVLTAAAFLASFMTTVMICRQRSKSDESMKVLRRIERDYRLFEKGVFIKDKSVLPEDWSKCQPKRWFSGGDWLHVISLFALMAAVVALVWLVPVAKSTGAGGQQDARGNRSTAAPPPGTSP